MQPHPGRNPKHHAALRQPLGQHLPRSREPAGEGAFRDAQRRGYRRSRALLEIARNEEVAVLSGEFPQLVVENRPQFGIRTDRRGRFGENGRWALPRVPPQLRPPSVFRHAVRDSVEPPGDRARRGDRRGPAGEHQEYGLERILCGVPVADDAATHTEHHRPVAGDEHGEGHIIAVGDVPIE
jgi:hypothetical protein